MTTTTAQSNRLINEQSGYLLQHAHNPVDWYPWGEEAFEKARTEDKPVFLSIGYSTCHWCHVMAHESFEDEEAALLLNAHFVPVKVDREERPDIDTVYMNVCQAMTGSGGWPLTIIMTPDKKPFFAGTYLPLRSKYGRIGLIDLLSRLATLWKQERDTLAARAEDIVTHFNETDEYGESAEAITVLKDGAAALQQMFVNRFGGFSHAPKFPMPHYLIFLLAEWKTNQRQMLRDIVAYTLTHMARGGLFDHAGGGFARYSTDEKWLVPHFEKMLYDNALLLQAYAQGFAVTGDPAFKHAAEKTAAYLMRDMQMEHGGYASAEDADSEGEEGKFYVWDYDELQTVLTKDEMALLESHYGVTPKGNFEGNTILNRIGIKGHADEADEAVLGKLFALREKRIHPFKDTKISAAWNGLAIQGMAEAGLLLGRNDYITSAQRAADFVLTYMTNNAGFTCGTYMNGPGGPAFLADYANMANALLALFKATRKPEHLEKTKALVTQLLALFRDDSGFSMTPPNAEALFMRPRDDHDGATPSGSSSAVLALVSLAHITGEPEWQDAADSAITDLLRMAAASPPSHTYFLYALLLHTAPHRQIVIAAAADNADAAHAYAALTARYDPFTTVIRYDGGEQTDRVLPHYTQYKTDAPFAAYVCENFACKQPVYSVDELLNSIKSSP